MGHHQEVEINKGVKFDSVELIYHERNPGQAVSDALPITTSRFRVELSIDDGDSGEELVLKFFSIEIYWKKGNKPNTLIVDSFQNTDRIRRNFIRELFGENNSIVLASGDGSVLSSMLMKFVNDMGAGRIYTASPDHTGTSRELRTRGKL